MRRVTAPEAVVLFRQLLDGPWSLLVKSPKAARRFGGHVFFVGQSWSWPALRSASASVAPHLLRPDLMVARADPRGQPGKLRARQLLRRPLNLFNRAHGHKL